MAKSHSHPEYQYLDLLKDILKNGKDKPIWGVEKTTLRSVFGRIMRFDLSKGFPLLTTKKVYMRGIIHELVWLISGSSNIKYLVDNDVHIWDDWAFKNYREAVRAKKEPELTQDEFIAKIKTNKAYAKKWGELGPVYGVQWRKWKASDGRKIDQLKWAIEKVKNEPERKSIVVSAWNPEFSYEMAAKGKSMVIVPCHMFYHLNVNNGKLSLLLYQRSCDMFLGVPFNIASYALLTLLLAQATGLRPGEFVHVLGDAHIYSNHFKQVREQIKRVPKKLPEIKLNPKTKNIDDFKFEDIEIINYNPYPPIKGDITLVGGFGDKKN